MNDRDELIGTHINEFEILGRDFEKEAIQKSKGYHQIYYICRCSCGNIKSILKGNLTSGRQKSCGCKIKIPSNFEDLTGRTFNKLKVIERDLTKKPGTVYWICQCECKNIVSVQAGKLKSGHTKSCGCWQKEQAHNTHFKDLSGMYFGKLKVIDRVKDKHDNGQTYWNCQCKCGSKTVVTGGKLVSGHTFSCGCSNSYGEYIIKEYLNKLKIEYKNNFTFSDCLSNKGKRLKFDFAIKIGNIFYIVEFDGPQHFVSSGRAWDTEENLKGIQERDKIKNKYCFDRNIPIIRIPYTELYKLMMKDLFIETTSFLLTRDNECNYYNKYTELLLNKK